MHPSRSAPIHVRIYYENNIAVRDPRTALLGGVEYAIPNN